MSLAGRLVDRLLGFPPPRTRRVQVERDLRIPMPDGVILLADRYRPPGTAPLPAILVRTPYGRRSWGGAIMGAAVARQGFQVVIQSVRGTFGSGGEFRAFRQERADGLATAEWVRAQPWCDGRLAMSGGSYLGYAQWAVAPYLDPPLTAMCPGITAADIADHNYPGGSFGLSGALSWTSLLARQETAPLGGFLPSRARAQRFERALRHLPLHDADLIATGERSQPWRELVDHHGDDFWAPADHSPAVAMVTTPVSMVTGWYDHFLPWQLGDFRTLAGAGRPPRLTIGPWSHGELAVTAAMLRDQLAWFRLHLDGQPDDRAPVRVYLQNAGRWLDLDTWPPESTPTPLYLAAGGRLSTDRPGPGEPDRFTYDPADPTPLLGGPHTTARQRDNRPTEARADVLVYTTDPLPRDLDVVGEIHAEIHLHTDPGHADVFVRLCDVHPDGTSLNVCDRLLRRHPGDASPAGIALFPTGYRFRQGHRIRVQIAGGAFPRFARNHGTGDPLGTAVHMRQCRFEIRHDPDHPSHVLLPVLGAEPLG